MKLKVIIAALCLCCAANAQDIVNVADYGVTAGTRVNAVNALKKAVDACKGKDNPILFFPKGRYDFWPETLDIPNLYDSTIPLVPENVGITLTGIDNLTVEGNGSEFIFHSFMQIMAADSCTNLTVRNFSADWDRPLISQCQVRKITPEYVDISIDRQEYPYIIDRGRICFIGEGWQEEVHGPLMWFNNLYDKDSREIKYNTWDSPFGVLLTKPCEELQNGDLRFYGQVRPGVAEGDYATIFHSFYTLFGLRFTNCKDVMLKDIAVYHALGYGISGERCENMTFDNVNMTVNEAKDRVFSISSDACNLTNCKGRILFENVNHTGHADDWLNVHSAYSVVSEVIDSVTVDITEEYQYTGPGDEVWFVNRSTSQRDEVRTVKSVEQLPSIKSEFQPFPVRRFRVTFTEPIPERIAKGDFFENKTYVADLEVRNCKILRKHRARGILFTTPGHAVIEDNYFSTAGTAILIDGDTDRWYEGGGCTDVTIRDNVFDNCLTSGNRDGNRNQWGEAVITIMPTFNTVTRQDDTYHKHIHIEGNTFNVFDAPIVFARSTGDLTFTGNNVVKNDIFKPYTWQKSAFMLDGCRGVVIKNNIWDQAYDTRLIQTKNMIRKDINLRDKGFRIEPLPETFKTYLEWH